MIRANFSQAYRDKKARIARLPQLYTETVRAGAKYMAEELVRNFHDGIKNDSLGLVPLKDRTVSRKEALGYDKPESPLYGLGDDEAERSYSNMMRIKKDGKRYVVRPSKALHWTRKITLLALFRIHEYGCTIVNGFGRGITIRIPPRPAFRYAYDKLMQKLEYRDPAAEVRAAARRFVLEGDDRAFKEIARRETGEYDEA